MDIMKLAPEAVLKPWGLAHGGIKPASAIAVGVGELWLASAQTGPGNCANQVIEPRLNATLAQVLQQAEADGTIERLIGPQPTAALAQTPYRGKTESWHIREAVGHTGIVAGPRTDEQKEDMRALLAGGEVGPDVENWPPHVRETFGIIEPLGGGEVFMVPAGTLHTMFAVGPHSLLIIDEVQQGYGACRLPTLSKMLAVQSSLLSVQVHPSDETVAAQARGELEIDQDLSANPTVRISDFGRRPGEHPDLGFELTKVPSGLRLVRPVSVGLDGGAAIEFMVACPQFAKARLSIPAGVATALRPAHGSYHVLHCAAGAARALADGAERSIKAGETLFVPAELEASLRIAADADCLLYDDTVPDLQAVRELLVGSGATPADIAGLLDPAPALRSE